MVFDNWHEDDNNRPFFFAKLFTILRNSVFRKNQFNYYKEIEEFSIPRGVKFIKFSPLKKLQMSRHNINNENARRVFEQGYNEILGNKKLLEFIVD